MHSSFKVLIARSTTAMQILDKLMKQPVVMPYMIAELYSGLGENDRAFT